MWFSFFSLNLYLGSRKTNSTGHLDLEHIFVVRINISIYLRQKVTTKGCAKLILPSFTFKLYNYAVKKRFFLAENVTFEQKVSRALKVYRSTLWQMNASSIFPGGSVCIRSASIQCVATLPWAVVRKRSQSYCKYAPESRDSTKCSYLAANSRLITRSLVGRHSINCQNDQNLR